MGLPETLFIPEAVQQVSQEGIFETPCLETSQFLENAFAKAAAFLGGCPVTTVK